MSVTKALGCRRVDVNGRDVGSCSRFEIVSLCDLSELRAGALSER